jgi:hypothetical protein
LGVRPTPSIDFAEDWDISSSMVFFFFQKKKQKALILRSTPYPNQGKADYEGLGVFVMRVMM